MAISQIELQYQYSGKGPVDSKSLVKTYSALISQETWLNNAGKVSAYNGMVVAVWLDSDPAKNGVYRLHDPAVTNILKTPDVTKESNWHKLAEISDLTDLRALIAKSATRDEVEAALANKLDRMVLEGYYTKAETYSKAEVDELLDGISTNISTSAASILSQLEKHVQESSSKFAEITTWTTNFDANIRPILEANARAIAVLTGDASTEGSVKKLIADAVEAIPAATLERLGLVKASAEVTVDADGTLGIGYVSTDKLVQGKVTLVLSGGDADPSDDQ